MNIEFASTPEVRLVGALASDVDVIKAMLVSTVGDELWDIVSESGEKGTEGRIRFLMRNRHGTPFEHTYFRFFVSAPISVFREFHRHRIGFSYNEESARYKQLKPKFYVPDYKRPLKQVGKAGNYTMEPAPELYQGMSEDITYTYSICYAVYERMIENGVAKEVARQVLPVGIYSSMFVSCNARSLMSFLSLRTYEPTAKFPSKPMYEIEQVAREMEDSFKDLMPITYNAFCEHGRVAP